MFIISSLLFSTVHRTINTFFCNISIVYYCFEFVVESSIVYVCLYVCESACVRYNVSAYMVCACYMYVRVLYPPFRQLSKNLIGNFM